MTATNSTERNTIMPLRWYAPVNGQKVSNLEESPIFHVVNGKISHQVIIFSREKKTLRITLEDEHQVRYVFETSSQNDFEDLYQITGVRDLRPLVGMRIRIYLRNQMDEEDCNPKSWFYTFAIDRE